MKPLRLLMLIVLLSLTMPLIAQEETETPADNSDTTPVRTTSATPEEFCDDATPARLATVTEFDTPETVLEADVDYRAIFCTSAGPVYIDLLEDYTPETVNNFIFLAEQNYYNNMTFHRVIEDFMAQSGDPTGTGAGGPGYQFADEIVGFLNFDRSGLLAMANAGPGTNGSQFFITTAETPWLNGNHTIFGEVLEGQDNVDNILLRDPQAGGEATDLETVLIIRNPEIVVTTFEETRETATADTFVDGLTTFASNSGLPEDVTVIAPSTLTTEEVASNAPDELTEDYLNFLTENGHDFRVTSSLNNENCNSNYFFVTMVYAVDAFEDADAASAVMESDFLPTYYEALGYIPVISEVTQYNAYATAAEQCGEDEVAMTLDVQRGRYIANISVIFPQGMASQFNLDDLAEVTATRIAQLFEGSLSEAYLPELR